MSPHRFLGLFLAVTPHLVACAPPAQDDADSSGSAMSGDETPDAEIPVRTCSGVYKENFARLDRSKTAETFDVVVEPGAAAQFFMTSLSDDATLEVSASRTGRVDQRVFRVAGKGDTNDTFFAIGNTSGAPETWRFSVERSGRQQDTSFLSECFPIDGDGTTASGMGGKALCLPGKACLKEGSAAGRCKTDSIENLADAVGQCW